MLGLETETPAICGCCGRLADPCHVKGDDADTQFLWFCGLCGWKRGIAVSQINPAKLREIEATALQASARQEADNMIGAVVTVLWNAGVRDLSAVSAEKAAACAEALGTDTEYLAAIFRLFLGYTNTVRKAVEPC